MKSRAMYPLFLPPLAGFPASARLLLLCAACVPLVAACGGSDAVCGDGPDKPYLAAGDHAPLRVPGDLTRPDRSAELTIPEVKAPSASGGGCLDAPPSYFRSAGVMARTPEEVVASWAQAWAHRETDALLALYSKTFKAPTDTSGAAAWLQQRREQVATGPVPDPKIEGLKVEPDGEDRRVVSFVQNFGHNSLHKQLTLVRESGSWRIAEETVAGVN